MTIEICWSQGAPVDPLEDAKHAWAAAEKVLAGIDPLEASLHYFSQYDDFGGDTSQMTGLAALWRDAQKAANFVVTGQPHQPIHGSVLIRAY